MENVIIEAAKKANPDEIVNIHPFKNVTFCLLKNKDGKHFTLLRKSKYGEIAKKYANLSDVINEYMKQKEIDNIIPE